MAENFAKVQYYGADFRRIIRSGSFDSHPCPPILEWSCERHLSDDAAPYWVQSTASEKSRRFAGLANWGEDYWHRFRSGCRWGIEGEIFTGELQILLKDGDNQVMVIALRQT